MVRLIDATRIEQYILNNCSDNEEINAIYAEIVNAPTVDAVEVVRCKGCKWASACYGDIVRASKGGGEVHIPLGTDGYCSFAERREDGKTD